LHGNGQSALQRQEAGEFQALETQDAPVVNHRAGRLEKALLGFIALVGFDHLGDRPDGQLRRKAELLAHLGINEFLQSKLGRATLPKRDFGDEGAGFVKHAHGVFQRRALGVIRQTTSKR